LRPALAGLLGAVAIISISDLVVLYAFPGQAAAFDQAVRLAVHSIAAPGVTGALRLLTWLGAPVVLAALGLAAFFVLRAQRRAAWLPLAALAACFVVTETAKWIVRRPRPAPWFGLATPETWSFPSGHSLNSMVCYVAFAAALAPRSRWRWAAVALAVTIGFTRIYLGVHWPTDVLTGLSAGACLAAGLVRAARSITHGD
jgi:membrane-associated phospholipid phosphatase